ncbi:general secretion pathway protein GspK [Rubritalea marina]|uniref:general secretion pathway protein GspK n=1 Tax=Rubritalea marina TaxID=361055 RepID=UPI0003654538|nr:type II secretion system protein GspK [Rubritalea marina]
MRIPRKKITSGRRAIALVAVLWVMGVISSLLVVTLGLLKMDFDRGMEQSMAVYAWQQAHSGFSYAVHPGVDRDDTVLQYQDSEYDEGYSVKIMPSGVQLNLNHVLQSNDSRLLVNLFELWGMDPSLAEDLVDAMVDWVDGDDLVSLNGAEADFYRDQGFFDRPHNRPFRHVSECHLVRGFHMLEQLKPNWREYFTLWSDGPLDAHEALPELLAAAAEVELSQCESYRSLVRGEDGLFGTEDDVKFQSVDAVLDYLLSPAGGRDIIKRRFIIRSSNLRIESLGYSGTYKCLIEAISAKAGGNAPLLYYRETYQSSEK